MKVNIPKPSVKKINKRTVFIGIGVLLLIYVILSVQDINKTKEIPKSVSAENGETSIENIEAVFLDLPASYDAITNEKKENEKKGLPWKLSGLTGEPGENSREKTNRVVDGVPQEPVGVDVFEDQRHDKPYIKPIEHPYITPEQEQDVPGGKDKKWNRSVLFEIKEKNKAGSENNTNYLPGKSESLTEAERRANELLEDIINQKSPSENDGKTEFMASLDKRSDIYLDEKIEEPRSPYQIMAGSILPAVMISGINSDLPGDLIAQVRENVYDTITGNYLLVPQGSRLFGSYDSGIVFGQDRVLFGWTRIVFPNGASMVLRGMAGVDSAGYAGLADTVNNHYGRLTGAVLMSAFLSVGTAQLEEGNVYTEAASKDFNSAGQKIVGRALSVNPTIEVRPGFKFNVLVNKDIILKPYKN